MIIIDSKKLKMEVARKAFEIRELSKLAKVSPKTIVDSMRQDREVRCSVLGRLARALECSPEQLVS